MAMAGWSVGRAVGARSFIITLQGLRGGDESRRGSPFIMHAELSCGEKDEPKFRSKDGWMVGRGDWHGEPSYIRRCGPFQKREVLLL